MQLLISPCSYFPLNTNLSNVKNELQWKFLKTVTGTTEIALPDQFSEICVKIYSSVNVFPNILLGDNYGMFDMPFGTGSGTYKLHFCRVYIKKTAIKLNEIYDNGTDRTSSAPVSVYYR